MLTCWCVVRRAGWAHGEARHAASDARGRPAAKSPWRAREGGLLPAILISGIVLVWVEHGRVRAETRSLVRVLLWTTQVQQVGYGHPEERGGLLEKIVLIVLTTQIQEGGKGHGNCH